jgi:hypothetical protein
MIAIRDFARFRGLEEVQAARRKTQVADAEILERDVVETF